MKKAIKITAGIVLTVVALLIGGYYYITANAERIIKSYVSQHSDGKLKLEVKKVEFKPRTLSLHFTDAHLYHTDTVNQATTYDVKISNLILDLARLNPLLFRQKLVMDSIKCMRPQITVTIWKAKNHEQFSLATQMGKSYEKLDDVMQNLKIGYCLIDSGSFTLIDKVKPSNQPMVVTDFYLRIDNLTKKKNEDSENRYLFSDRIKFYSSNQDILFHNGLNRLKYKRLRINSLQQSIEIDSCSLSGKRKEGGFDEYEIFFDTLRISHADFNKITHASLIKADSAICINPVIKISTRMQDNKPHFQKELIASEDSMQSFVKSIFGNIDINYIGVKNASAEILTKKDGNISSFASRKVDFAIHDVFIIDKPTIPIRVARFYLNLNSYKAYNPDSSYLVSFDSVVFNNKLISLTNFAITPTKTNSNFTNRKEISMAAFQLKNISWYEFIANKKIVADEAIMQYPSISISGQKRAANAMPHRIFNAFQDFGSKVDIQSLRIEHAELDYQTASKKSVLIHDINTVISMDSFLQAQNLTALLKTINRATFSSGSFNAQGNNLWMQNGAFLGKTQGFHLEHARVTGRNNAFFARFTGLRLEIFSQPELTHFSFQKMGWDEATIDFNMKKLKTISTNNRPPKSAPLELSLGKIDGRNTKLNYMNNNVSISAFLHFIKADNMEWHGKTSKPTIEGLVFSGQSLKMKQGEVSMKVSKFDFADNQLSTCNEISVLKKEGQDSLHVLIPKMVFSTTLSSILNKKTAIDYMHVSNPLIHLPAEKTAAQTTPSLPISFPKLSLTELKIENPSLDQLPGKLSKSFTLNNQKSSWHFKEIISNAEGLQVSAIRGSIADIAFHREKIQLLVPKNGSIHFVIKQLNYIPENAEKKYQLSAKLDSLEVRSVQLQTGKEEEKKIIFDIQQLNLQQLNFKEVKQFDLFKTLSDSKNFQIDRGYFSVTSDTTYTKVYNLKYDASYQSASVDAFQYKPTISRDSFNLAQKWQKDYISLETGKISFIGIDFTQYRKDSLFNIQKIIIDSSKLEIYKDLRLPFKEGIIKELPTTLISNMKTRVQIDSIQLRQAFISYEEFNEKTKQAGLVSFHHTNALIENFSSFGMGQTDSLKLSATSWFLDSAFLRFRFHQSYTDSLHGFLFALRMKPFKMTVLNHMLIPLASALIKTGNLDTLRMNAVGREYLAHGKMKMYYRNLKVQYLDKGNKDSKTLKTKLITFLANSLLLHRNNQHGYGEVYAERIRERSVFNYWIKMIVSGVISNTGIKSNKKQIKKYGKAIKRLNVPEIPESAW